MPCLHVDLHPLLQHKSWYSCLSRFGFDIPNLGNYASFIKIFVVYACFYAAIGITGFLPIEYGLFFDFETSFPISMLLMMGVIYIINYFFHFVFVLTNYVNFSKSLINIMSFFYNISFFNWGFNIFRDI